MKSKLALAAVGLVALAGCTSSSKHRASPGPPTSALPSSATTPLSSSGSAPSGIASSDSAPSGIAIATSGAASATNEAPPPSPAPLPNLHYAQQYSTIAAPMLLELNNAQKLKFPANATPQQLSAALLPLGMRLTASDSSLINVAWPSRPTPVEADVKALIAANMLVLNQLAAATSLQPGGLAAYLATLHSEIAASLAHSQTVTTDLAPPASTPASPSS
ncbi:MAG TPA: hypothetical protein VK662_08775 [Acidothermaceae bacterium]|nr:hypothetical protein [Acidothermaceae bacterium]